MHDEGKIIIKLNDMLVKNKLSKNKFSLLANMQRSQLNQYCNNKLQRIDLNVLERICSVLDCDISDVLSYERGERK